MFRAGVGLTALVAAAGALAAFVLQQTQSNERHKFSSRNSRTRLGKDCNSEIQPESTLDISNIVPFEGNPLERPPSLYTDHIKAGLYRPSMGLAALDMTNYTEIDSTYIERINERRQVVKEYAHDVVCMLPVAKEAASELLCFLGELLCKRYPTCFESLNEGKGILNKVTGNRWEDLAAVQEPMLALGGLVIDDVAILTQHSTEQEPGDTAHYKLVAAINAYSFPGELMRSKIGRAMEGVHSDVPNFNSRLLKPVDSWLGILASPSHRFNWGLQVGYYFFRPTYLSSSDSINAAPPEFEEIHVRVEKQTFIRLPKTKALVFGIRTFVYSLSQAIEMNKVKERVVEEAHSGSAPSKPFVERIYSAVSSMDAANAKYKNLTVLNPLIKKWLEDNKGMSEAHL